MQIELNDEEFKNLYFSKKTKDLAKELGISESTLIKKAHSLGFKKARGRAKNSLKIVNVRKELRLQDLNKQLCEVTGCNINYYYTMDFYVSSEPDRPLSAGFAPLEGESLEDAVFRMREKGFLGMPINITEVHTKPLYIRFDEPANFVTLLKFMYQCNGSYSFVFCAGDLEAQLIYDSIQRCEFDEGFKKLIKDNIWN